MNYKQNDQPKLWLYGKLIVKQTILFSKVDEKSINLIEMVKSKLIGKPPNRATAYTDRDSEKLSA